MHTQLWMAAVAATAVMVWDPSPSPDVMNCYSIFTQQRSILSPDPRLMNLDSHYRPRGVVCGPPFVWAMPPDPPPGWVQYFCLRAVDTSDNLSACAEITFLK